MRGKDQAASDKADAGDQNISRIETKTKDTRGEEMISHPF